MTTPPDQCNMGDLHAVYTLEHADIFLAAGYERVPLRFHNPELALPDGLDAVNVAPSSSKRARGATCSVTTANLDSDERSADLTRVLTTLCMPGTEVPAWDTRDQLIEMMEQPFYSRSKTGVVSGPYSPVYLWPHSNGRRSKAAALARAAAGGPNPWTQKHTDSMARLFEDYYNLKVRADAVRAYLEEHSPELCTTKEGDQRATKDPLTSTKIPKFWRLKRKESQWARPSSSPTWRECVLEHLKQTKSDFQDPDQFLLAHQ